MIFHRPSLAIAFFAFIPLASSAGTGTNPSLAPVIRILKNNPQVLGVVQARLSPLLTSIDAMPQARLPRDIVPADLPPDVQNLSRGSISLLLAHPGDVAPEESAELDALIGAPAREQLQRRISQTVAAPQSPMGLALRQIRQRLLPDGENDLGETIRRFYDKSPGAPALVAGNPAPVAAPAASAAHQSRLGLRPLMDEEDFSSFLDEPYLGKQTRVQVRKTRDRDGKKLEMKVAYLPAGVYRPEYDAYLRRVGVHVVMIRTPDRDEVMGLGEDREYFLKPAWYSWVSRVAPKVIPEFLADMGSSGTKMAARLRKSLPVVVNGSSVDGPQRLTLENFAQWYKLYDHNVQTIPGFERLVQPDAMEREMARNGSLEGWWGQFYYALKNRRRMIGGHIMREHPAKNLLWGHYAAYDDESEPYDLSVRSFAVGMELAHKLRYRAYSLGEDWNLRGFDRGIGLFGNKASLQAVPYPSEDMEIIHILDKEPFRRISNPHGLRLGILFLAIRRDTAEGLRFIEKYLASLRDGVPSQPAEILGYDFYSGDFPAAERLMVARQWIDDRQVDQNGKTVDVRVPLPHGLQSVREPLTPARQATD